MFTKNRKMSKSLIVMLLVLSLVLQAFIPIAAFAQSTVYSVAEYMKMTATNAPVTVEGYVVGARDDNSFSETTESNLVLGETKTLGSPTEGVTVQLSTTVRDQYSIVKNPALIGQKVRVTGNSEDYFKQIGIKGTISLEVVEDTGEPTDPTQPTDPVVPVEPTDITSIADVRAGEQGQVYSVQGTVISKENAWGGNGFYLQDATGGLYIYPGTKQNVTLGNNVILTGTLSSYGGSLQLTAVTAKFDKGTAEVPAATTTTIGTLDTASQHTLVKLENVTVTELTEQNYGTAEFRAEDADGNKVLIRLDNRSGENYTTLSASYKNGDIINVSGILTTYNSNYQILPFDMTHFEMVTAYEGDPISSEELLTVGQIQGAAHKSPHEGKAVLVKDVVITHVSGNNNYYVQDITPDNDPNTSDAIAVFSRAHGLAVGDQVELVGKVIEYFGAGYADTKRDTDLTITQLEVSKATKVGTAKVPAPIKLDDTSVPKENIKVSDAFDPTTNSLDFWEAHEGMLVGLENAKIVGPQRYGDLYVLPSDTTDQLNKLGGYVLKPNQNPNIISILTGNNKLVAKAGDTIEGLITGPVSYAYSAYKLDIPSAKLTIVDGGMKAEQSTIVADENKITVAAYNVENYSAASSTTDAKSQRIANSIVNELGQPDIIALVEMQDNDGQTDSGVTSAQESANRLIKDIVTAGGVKYTYGEVAPTNNTSGGAPGANIRVGFIYNEARVTLKSLEAIGTDLPEFQNTRKSLSGTFEFNGQEVLVIGNHFNSKGGDEPLFGSNQPPTLGSVPERLGIAKKVNEYVANKLTATPDLDVVVLGDFNDFEFSEPLTTLEGDILTNLVKNHPVEDRFSYFYQGNSQTLDHILVSNGLVEKATFDMVHLNAMFMEEHGRASDHDPVIVQFPVEKTATNDVVINLLHTNDVHGRAEAGTGIIGYPIYKTIIEEYKAKGNTLVLDAGDAVHGTNFATL
ncbi:MAG: nuclease, partial [Tissierellia bacterium]|nr:nuclease [Tissierellia bacterium]